MKKIIIILALCLASFGAKAQDMNRARLMTDFGYTQYFSFEDNGSAGNFSYLVTGGVQTYDDQFYGITTGFNIMDGGFRVPILFNYTCYFSNLSYLTAPYVSFNIGYDLDVKYLYSGGKVGFEGGLDFLVSDNFSIYTKMCVDLLYQYNTFLGGAGIKIGFSF